MMRLAVVALLIGGLTAGSSAEKSMVGRAAVAKSKVGRAAVAAMEKSMDDRFVSLWPDDPVMMVGLTQGIYITGYGVVFTAEVNLAPGSGITPFHPTASKEEIARIHQKKLDRMLRLKEAMEQVLLSSAASLDAVPGDEQIALGVSLFHWHWENTTGLPAQIVMHAPKKALVLIKTGVSDRASLASALRVEEF